jgi:hypothetical protein
MIPPAIPSARASWLCSRACQGVFEAHLTVQANSPERREAFRQVCDELGVKCVLIELARGLSRSQPMTASYHHGELSRVLAEVETLHARLWEQGFPVVRVKLEAVASNPGVPDTDAEAADWADAYFEFHAKVRLGKDADRQALRQVCSQHGAHLSRNDRKRDEDGSAERFVTMRVYHRGRRQATQAYEALLHDLGQAGYPVVSQQREFTIYDGRAELDAGWLDSPDEGSAS